MSIKDKREMVPSYLASTAQDLTEGYGIGEPQDRLKAPSTLRLTIE